MPEERIIPSVQTVAEFVISINDAELPRTVQKAAINVTKIVNRIATATIIINDGSPNEQDFPLSNGDLFIPGNKISIKAGDADNQTIIFEGIIIKHSLKVRANAAPKLIIECKHKAVKATAGRKSACFHDMTDAEVFDEILKGNGFGSNELDIEDSQLQHKELVQYNCTDWDFILNRAEMIGKIILTNNEQLTIKAPTTSGESSLDLLFGSTIIELDAEMDSRNQYSAVSAKAWDIANQAVVQSDATEPSDIEEQGDFSVNDLAAVEGLSNFTLTHGGALTEAECKAWADAQLLKARLSKIRGRVKINGIATFDAGDIISLNGLGNRFNGKAFVSGIRHDYTSGEGWKTQVQFGIAPDWFAAEQPNIVAPKASGLLPGITGLQIGIVTDNEDPAGEMRVRVKMPLINAGNDGVWARMALTDAGNNRGMFFRPEVGDEVILGFLQDDPRQPVILGMLNSSALPSPITPSNDNHQKGYTSREKLVMLFDDDKKFIQLQTPGGNKVTISDDAKGIVIEDQNSNKIEMNNQGITITAAQKLELKAGTQLVIGGPQLSLSGDSSAEIKGGGSTAIKSGGALQLTGSIVQIN